MSDEPVKTADQGAPPRFKHYDRIMAAFVTILLLSNLIGASKPSYVILPGGMEWSFGAGVLFFPVSYIIGDVLTEVYGYARARRVIWTGFAALLFMAFMAWAVVSLPAADGWDGQEAYEKVFGNTWRIVAASMIAFWAGEFANSYVLAKMKVWTKGKALWTRTIGSTVVGQPDLLSARVLWPRGMAARAAVAGRHLAMADQDRLGSDPDPLHLSRGQLAEARGGCRNLRYRHRFLALRDR